MRPAKLLSCNLQSLQPLEFVLDDNPAWISQNQPYKWVGIIDVEQQPHSYGGSQVPYFYNGLDVDVGDYIITTGQARILKIISITNKTDHSVNCILEDENKSNLYQDITQSAAGNIQLGEGFIFSVVNGYPILYPMPTGLDFSNNYVSQIYSKFAFYQKERILHINQFGHGFTANDLITIDHYGKYRKANYIAGEYDNIVGIVTKIRNVSEFSYQPIGQFININLPSSSPGEVLYLDPDNPGKVTTTVDSNVVLYPALIKIDDDTAIFANLNSAKVDTTPDTKIELVSINNPWAKLETLMLTETTTDANPKFLLYEGNQIELQDNNVYSFNLDIIGIDSVGEYTVHKQLMGTIKTRSSQINLESEVITNTVQQNALWNVNCTVKQPNVLRFAVTGEINTIVKWNGRLDLNKVAII